MKLILGIDEVGRGAWAGPLVVGAVVLDQNNPLCHPELVSGSTSSSSSGLSRGSNDNVMDCRNKSGNDRELKLNDSKKLSAKQREKLSREIKKSAVAIGVGWVDAPTIDRIGLSDALKLATRRACDQIDMDKVSEIIIDGTINLLDDPRAITMIKADGKIAAVSAASIIAKVFRDHYMAQLDKVFPDYDFAQHVGYGTKSHLSALERFGAIPGIHRQSFTPIAKLTKTCHSERSRGIYSAKKIPRLATLARNDRANKGLSGYNLGRIAENVAAKFLEQHSHQIVAQNWKSKLCEIDIVSTRAKTLYFTEVKYRENARHGDGLSAITPKKLKQMKFAVEIFLQKHAEFAGNYDVKIAVVSLSQNPPRVDEFIDDIT